MKHTKGIYMLAMLIFGSMSLFVRNIELSSGQIAMVRGMVGCSLLLAACPVMKQKLSIKVIQENLLILIISGAAIGFNWILLFQAYRYTSIANATLSYYFAPVFIIFLSPIFLKEQLTVKKVLCVFGAVLGMFLVVRTGGEIGRNNIMGIFFGLSAAILYAFVVIMNKFLKGLSGIETTVIQLGSASVVLLPYVLFTERFKVFSLDTKSLILLAIVGIFHTGLAYLMYFTAVRKLTAQTIAVFSYIDPISAILLSFLILGEQITWMQAMGGILILGAAFISEIKHNQKNIRLAE